LRRDPDCTLCPLSRASRLANVCLPGHGPAESDVVILGEAPGAEEDRQGFPFVGPTGDLLNQLLRRFGIDRSACYVTNAVKCRPPPGHNPSAKEVTTCARAFLDAEIAAVKPRFILALGNAALQAVTGARGITAQRGRLLPYHPEQFAEHFRVTKSGRKLRVRTGPSNQPAQAHVFPTYHPAAILHDERYRPQVTQDIRHFVEIIRNGGPIKETHLNPILVDTPAALQRLLAALRGTVSVDLETNLLYPWGEPDERGDRIPPRITALGFGTKLGEFIIFPAAPLLPPLGDLLELLAPALDDCFIIGQNLKFDALWLKVLHGFELRQDFDTLLAHYLIDENSPHDLEYLARLYFSAPAWDIPLAHKQQAGAHRDQVLPYLAHDLYYTRALFPVLNKQLHNDPRLLDLFQLLFMPLANLFVQMEYHGVHIDTQGLDGAEATLISQIAQRKNHLFYDHAPINWNSAIQVRNYLFGEELHLQDTLQDDADTRAIYTPKQEYSTSETALNQYDHPLIDELLKLRADEKQLSVYIRGWWPYIIKGPDILHPFFKLHGTVTGRASAEHPNLQQTPRDPRIRSLILPPTGWALWEADLSQIELRLIAEAAGDPVMLDIFAHGQDIHFNTAVAEIARAAAYHELVLATAAQLGHPTKNYGHAIEAIRRAGPKACEAIDPQWKELRYNAKSINFGYAFGMGWKHFKRYAKDNYDIRLSSLQAQQSRSAFFQTYPRLEAWHRKVRSAIHAQGFIRDLAGQRRRLPRATDNYDTPERAEAERQAINSPIQGFAAKINFFILLQLAAEFPPNIFRPIATVHDAILAYVRPQVIADISRRYLQVVQRPDLFDPFGIELGVPLEGEVKIGRWGAGISLDKYLDTTKPNI
jgi:uracil-DNA glycosylase family 4